MKKANGEDKPGSLGQLTPEAPDPSRPDPGGPLTSVFPGDVLQNQVAVFWHVFLKPSPTMDLLVVGEIMKKLKVRPKVIKTRQQQNDPGSRISSLE